MISDWVRSNLLRAQPRRKRLKRARPRLPASPFSARLLWYVSAYVGAPKYGRHYGPAGPDRL